MGKRIKMRNSIKAIIIRDEQSLVTRATDDLGDYYLLPGGGQEPGESMTEALQRECLEKIGTKVVVHDLRVVRDYIGKNHEELIKQEADKAGVKLRSIN